MLWIMYSSFKNWWLEWTGHGQFIRTNYLFSKFEEQKTLDAHIHHSSSVDAKLLPKVYNSKFEIAEKMHAGTWIIFAVLNNNTQ